LLYHYQYINIYISLYIILSFNKILKDIQNKVIVNMTRKDNKDLPTVEVDITPHDEGNVKCSSSGIIVFVLGLVSGTFSALLCKMAYDSKSIGLDNREKLFAKPIMMLLLMFAAVLLLLLYY